MSDRKQKTAHALYTQMTARYDTEHHHKHDKRHLKYTKNHTETPPDLVENENKDKFEGCSGQVRQLNFRRYTKGMGTRRVH